MRPCVEKPLRVRGLEIGGPQPVYCVPLVARDLCGLLAQAERARELRADMVEWRADFSADMERAAMVDAAIELRAVLEAVPVIFTLRAMVEGGAREISQAERRACIEAVTGSGAIDLLDLELANEPEFLHPLVSLAHRKGVRVILAFHDFSGTPPTAALMAKIASMRASGADIGKIAVMPQSPDDVVRLFEFMLEARRAHPGLPLSIMGMGALGSITRMAGFLFGSDFAFAAGQESSAPGQAPIREARLATEILLKFAQAGRSS